LYLGHIIEGGLGLPLDPLILEVMKVTGVPLSRLSINVVKLVYSLAALKKRHNLVLGVKELFYCYQLVRSKNPWFYHLIARRDTPELFLCIPDIVRGMMEAYIVVTAGPILPPGAEDFQFPRVSTMSKMLKFDIE
jgi:hypothetical protein